MKGEKGCVVTRRASDVSGHRCEGPCGSPAASDHEVSTPGNVTDGHRMVIIHALFKPARADCVFQWVTEEGRTPLGSVVLTSPARQQ